ncbi:MAG: hypothetical protein IPG53_23180 [Ignavibacteriales bacterium]|nr:hypothetical protein [Ignavibacteriales bacterium]
MGSDQTQYGTGLTSTNLLEKGYFKVVLSRSFIDYDSRQSDSLLNPIFKNVSREAEYKLRFEFFHQFSKITELTSESRVNTSQPSMMSGYPDSELPLENCYPWIL